MSQDPSAPDTANVQPGAETAPTKILTPAAQRALAEAEARGAGLKVVAVHRRTLKRAA